METNTTDMWFSAGDVSLQGTLAIPAGARGIVVFVHGSGSSRSSPRNRWVAADLQKAHLATLLFDLLTPAEAREDEATNGYRFDVELLARRLRNVTSELRQLSQVRDLRVGYFGASTGAAAALIAAAEAPEAVAAVVSRGGRPDLATPWLARVHAPTLLIVGGNDELVLSLNRDALKRLPGVASLEVIPRATHLFEELGALEDVSRLATRWFSSHLLHSSRTWSGPRFPDRRFRDRAEAGRLLAAELGDFAHRSDVIVLGLPRGGVPVAFEVARALDVALDVLIVRKLGLPGHEELAVGALASGGIRVLNPEELRFVSDDQIEDITRRERLELERREKLYRDGRPVPSLNGQTVILVDDGAATGATMRAAISAVRAQQPARLVVAVPTAPPETCAALASGVDELICLVAPELFFGVGQWYDDFSPCSDDAVRELVSAGAATVKAGR
jgi:predicted phosphoribosyltransferase/dienelactone hydrolase